MPDNAFDPEFLDAFEGQWPVLPTTEEARLAGPWEVRPWEQAWGVFSIEDARPRAVFSERGLALAAAALYPATGREYIYSLGGDKEDRGFPVWCFRGGTERDVVVGWAESFDVELLELLSVADHLRRSPVSLALMLEAAGRVALDRAGAILALRVLPAAKDPAAAVARAFGVEVTPELRQAVEAMRRQLGLEEDGEDGATGKAPGEGGPAKGKRAKEGGE